MTKFYDPFGKEIKTETGHRRPDSFHVDYTTIHENQQQGWFKPDPRRWFKERLSGLPPFPTRIEREAKQCAILNLDPSKEIQTTYTVEQSHVIGKTSSI